MGYQTAIRYIVFVKRGSTLHRKVTTHFKALLKNRWTDRPPQLVLPDAALPCIDPDSVSQAEREWMDGSALLTCPDLCNHVWPSAFPQLHLKFVNINNLYTSFPFSHSPVKKCILQTTQTRSYWVPLGYYIVYCVYYILHFSHFTGVWLQIIVHTVCFNCILYSAIFFVKPHSAWCVHPSTPCTNNLQMHSVRCRQTNCINSDILVGFSVLQQLGGNKKSGETKSKL